MRYEDSFDGKIPRSVVKEVLAVLGLKAERVVEVHVTSREVEIISWYQDGMPIHKALMPIGAGEPLRVRTRLLIED